MKDIGIGLLGFGTVGAGVVEGLQKNADLIADRLGVRLVLRKIADLDVESDRGVAVDSSILTKDAESVIADDSVDIVIELIGGTGIAKKLVLSALEAGKPVVTANKALLAKHGAEIFGLAVKTNTEIRFGASVGGGIPIIRALREGLIGNHIESICGILNGTCNYILTEMETEGLSFDEALNMAQEAGYAEADPALDIDGFDTAHKAVILASLAYGFNVPMGSVHVEGVRGLSAWDIKRAVDLGYRIKLLAVIRKVGDGVEVRVHP
ncbi:MAG: homoserine dehydrogenase, partial [Kiritimatiellae bacterium]|nr:homoserine dehydrogenase [Kiritimatiellia bacterium]